MLIKTKLTKKTSTVTAVGMWRTTESTTIHMDANYASIKAAQRTTTIESAHLAAVKAWAVERCVDWQVQLVQAGPTVCYWAVGYKPVNLAPVFG